MTFQPVVPLGGVGGWALLSRTRETQQQAFDRSPLVRRDTAYFEEKIGSITTAEELVADRRLLRVSLGAFGLDDDINSQYFIRKVLEGGTFDPKSLANRLSDKRYLSMAKSFGFGDVSPPNTVLSNFASKITAAYRERQFEAAVGQTAPDMRLALSLDRDLGDIATKSMSEKARWFTVMASPPLRSVFERVFSLPPSTGALDIDRQLQLFQEKAEMVFGSPDVSQFEDPAAIEDLRTKFLVRSDMQTAGNGFSQEATALAILQAAVPPRSFF